jgi:hypothetical protein
LNIDAHLYGELLRGQQDSDDDYGDEYHQEKQHARDMVGDEDDDEFDYIDINSLPNDQQQYFLQGDYNKDEDDDEGEDSGDEVE